VCISDTSSYPVPTSSLNHSLATQTSRSKTSGRLSALICGRVCPYFMYSSAEICGRFDVEVVIRFFFNTNTQPTVHAFRFNFRATLTYVEPSPGYTWRHVILLFQHSFVFKRYFHHNWVARCDCRPEQNMGYHLYVKNKLFEFLTSLSASKRTTVSIYMSPRWHCVCLCFFIGSVLVAAS